MKAALEAIAGAEGGWDSVNPGKVVPGLRNMTIAEAREAGMRQRSIEGSGALGKFQQMPVINGVNTLKQRAEAAGLNYERDKFNEENQTKITRAYIAGIYPGGEAQLVKDARKDPMILADKLKGVYPSLPGGSQQNVHTRGYLNRFRNAYAKYKAPSATPTQGSLAAVLPQGRPQFTSGFRSSNRPDHEGIDIGVDANSPVAALQDGVVETIYRNFGDWGDAVVVRHSDGTKWIYGHVISSVKKGDNVKRGQIIAKVKYWPGGKGYKDNTHLHLEKVVGGRKVNPTSYLNNQRNLTQLSSNPQSRNLDPTSSTSGKTLVAVLPVVNNNTKVVSYPIPVA
jgi:murein DD-endopeptidase MepM/ murein hydrolase activator NlpD